MLIVEDLQTSLQIFHNEHVQLLQSKKKNANTKNNSFSPRIKASHFWGKSFHLKSYFVSKGYLNTELYIVDP